MQSVSDLPIRACRGCGQPIVWLVSAKGRPTPADPALVTVMTEDGEVHKGRIPHHITCPQADQFRGKGGVPDVLSGSPLGSW